MKFLAFLLLLGFASASLHDALEEATHEYVLSFLEGMEEAPALGRHLATAHDDPLPQRVEDEVKSELGRRLKEGLQRILDRVKEAVEEGKEARRQLLDKLKELSEKLREVRERLGEDAVRELRERAREYLERLREKYGVAKRSSEDRLQEALSELNYRDMLKAIKEHLKKNVDPEFLKEKIEKLFGQGSELVESLLRTLREKGRRRLEMLIDALLGEDEDDEEEVERRGLKDYWEKVKDYFKDLHIDLQEKYSKFGEWVKDVMDKGMENSKDKLDNIRAIASEFARHAKNVSKEVGAEAMDFFRQYKNELGDVWEELKEIYKNRKD